MGCLNDWMWEHTTQSCLSGTFPQRHHFIALCHLLLNITGNHTCTSLALNLPQGKSHNSIKLKHYWWCTVTDQRFAFINKTKRCEEYSLLVTTRLWHRGLRYRMQYFSSSSSFTWTYMQIPISTCTWLVCGEALDRCGTAIHFWPLVPVLVPRKLLSTRLSWKTFKTRQQQQQSEHFTISVPASKHIFLLPKEYFCI